MATKVNNVQVETTDGGTANVNRVVVKYTDKDGSTKEVTVFNKGVEAHVHMYSNGAIGGWGGNIVSQWTGALTVTLTSVLDFPLEFEWRKTQADADLTSGQILKRGKGNTLTAGALKFGEQTHTFDRGPNDSHIVFTMTVWKLNKDNKRTETSWGPYVVNIRDSGKTLADYYFTIGDVSHLEVE